jgi:hypothetical protein
MAFQSLVSSSYSASVIAIPPVLGHPSFPPARVRVTGEIQPIDVSACLQEMGTFHISLSHSEMRAAYSPV